MSVYRYQAVILFPGYPSVISIEAHNDREALEKLAKMAEGKKLLKDTITRNGVSLKEHYRNKKAKDESIARKKRAKPRP